MKRLTNAFLLVATAALVAGCPHQTEQVFTGDIVATVNGEPITRAQLDLYSQRRGGQMSDEDLLNDLISIELLKQAAERDRLHLRDEVAGELMTQRSAILAQAAVRQRLETHEVTDDDIEREYQRFVDEEMGEELRASHILVTSREQAADLIAQLDQGADFAELAREHSQDGSAEAGGDLGWFEPDMMVEPFSEAAQALEPGNYTQEPVQTQFGWHVIRLEGRRAAEAPPLAEVSNEVRGFLQSQMVEAWVNELRERARIEIRDR
jgi:peptidyl-prolyl cis-trans isomerase C